MAPVKSKGMGVFCKEEILAGEVVEIAPCLLFSSGEAGNIDKTGLYDYYFSAYFLTTEEAKFLDIGDKEKAGLLACGVMGFCNHSSAPNCEIEKYMQQNRVFFKLRALKNIAPHEEITISYGEVWFNEID